MALGLGLGIRGLADAEVWPVGVSEAGAGVVAETGEVALVRVGAEIVPGPRLGWGARAGAGSGLGAVSGSGTGARTGAAEQS